MIALIMLVMGGLYLALAIFAVRAAKSRKGKVILALVFFLIPFGDALIGRAYFRYLCTKEGGVKVYQAVELGPEYYRADLTPIFIKANGNADEAVLGNKYHSRTEWKRNYSRLFHIAKNVHSVVELETGRILGSQTTFGYFGGWLVAITGLQVAANTCPELRTGRYSDFLQRVFRPVTPTTN